MKIAYVVAGFIIVLCGAALGAAIMLDRLGPARDDKAAHCAAARARVPGLLFSLRPAPVDIGRAATLELSYWITYCDTPAEGEAVVSSLLRDLYPEVRRRLVAFQHDRTP